MYTMKPPLGSQLDLSNPITRGLVCSLPMLEDGGSKTFDLSGYKNHGTLTNMSIPASKTSGWNPGKFGKSLLFDGINDYVEVAHKQSINFERTDKFTFSAWIRLTSIGSASTIIAKNDTTLVNRGIIFRISLSGNLDLFIINNSTTNRMEIVTTKVLSINVWYHVACTYSGTSNATGVALYVNGVRDAGNVVSNNLTATIINTIPLSIGYRPSGALNPFPGVIENVNIWNKVLSPQEAQQLYMYPYIYLK